MGVPNDNVNWSDWKQPSWILILLDTSDNVSAQHLLLESVIVLLLEKGVLLTLNLS
jgi:hypothetical protein